MLASSFSTRFLLRKNRRSRSLPPLGATCSLPHFRFAQMWPRIFPRGLPGYVPLFPGWPRARTPALAPIRSHFAPRNRAAGHRPHLLGLPRKSGRGISLRETTLCGCPLRGHGFATPHRCFAVPVTAPPRRAPNGKTPALAPIRSHFAPRNRAAGRCPRRGQRARYPIFAPRNRAGRSSAPPGPMFCRPRHGSAAPGPQRQNPGACSRSVAFRLRRNRAAGRCPRWGQRARYPIFAPLKCGPTLAPRRLLPFGRISLRETARPVIGPTGADVLPSPSRLRRAGSPTAKPRRLLPFGRISPAAKPRGRSLPPLGATCSLPHFRSAQMWPHARTPALLVFNPVFAAQKPAGAAARFRTAGR